MSRAVWHAVESWRQNIGQEVRFETACEGKGEDTEQDADGRVWCLECRRKLLER